MKLDMINTPQGIQDTARTKMLREIGHVCVVIPRFIPQYESQFSDISIELAKDALREFGIQYAAYFMFDIDAVTNTVALCAPIVSDDGRQLSFNPDDYRKAFRDDCWPVEVLDLQPVTGFTAISPYPRGASARSATDEKGGNIKIVK